MSNKKSAAETSMIKINLARSIAEQMNIHTKDAESFLTTFTDTGGDSLASGEPVRLVDFLHLRHQARSRTSGQESEDRRTCSIPCHTLPEGKILKAKAFAFKDTARKSEKCSPQKTEPSSSIKGKATKLTANTESN